MNWTGGRLQRHSRNTNAVTAKQKQHFARVRARLQNGERAQTVPFQPNFLPREDSILSAGLTPFGRGSHRHAGHARHRQRTLEEYDTTAPLAHRLSSLKKKSRQAQNVDRGSSRNKSERPSSHHHINPRKRTPQDSKSSSSVSSQGDSEQSRQGTTRNEDLSTEDAVLEANRKRLLQQEDWVGLGVSQPLMMEFASRQSGIAKRRKANSETRNRKAQLRDPNIPPPVRDAIYKYEPFMSGVIKNNPESIDIRIGSAALRSQAPPRVGIAEASPLTARTRQSSDHILFDETDEAQSVGVSLQTDAAITDFADENIGKAPLAAVYGPGVSELLDSLSVHLSGDSRLIPGEQALESEEGGVDLAEMSNPSDNNEDADGGNESSWIPVDDAGYSEYPQYILRGVAEQVREKEKHLGGDQSPEPENEWRYVSSSIQENVGQPIICEHVEKRFENSPIFSPRATNELSGDSAARLQEQSPAMVGLRAQPTQACTTTAGGLGFRRFLSLSASESSGKRWNDPRSKLPNQPTPADTAFEVPVARMLPQSQMATDGSSLRITGGGSMREVGSSVRGLQSPSASLRNILSLEQRPSIESKKMRDEALNEEMWKRFVFGSSDDNSSRSNGPTPPPTVHRSGEEQHASSVSVEVGTIRPARSVVQPETRIVMKSSRTDDPGSSLLVQGTSSTPVNMVTQTDSEDLEPVDPANVSDWGSGMDEIDEASLENNPPLSKYQANIHAGTASSQGTKIDRRKALSRSRSSMYDNVPTSRATGTSSDAEPLSTAAQVLRSSRHARLNVLASDTGATAGQHDSSSAAQPAPAQPQKRRIIFTKPSPFHGVSGAVRRQGPMHIGRIHAGKTRKGRSVVNAKAKSAAERQSPSVYDFPVSPSDEEIED